MPYPLRVYKGGGAWLLATPTSAEEAKLVILTNDNIESEVARVRSMLVFDDASVHAFVFLTSFLDLELSWAQLFNVTCCRLQALNIPCAVNNYNVCYCIHTLCEC